MSNEECEKVLKELDEVRSEKLNDEAKRLFEAIMKIADRKDEAESDLYEANNRINDLLDIVKDKEKLIDELVSEIIRVIYYYENYKECKFDYEISENITETRENIIKYFEERCK